MLAKSLISAVRKRGGTAELRHREGLRPEYAASEGAATYEVVGELNGYDIHAFCQGENNSFGHYTIRSISMRGHHDVFSDYNPGGYIFAERINALDLFCLQPRKPLS